MHRMRKTLRNVELLVPAKTKGMIEIIPKLSLRKLRAYQIFSNKQKREYNPNNNKN